MPALRERGIAKIYKALYNAKRVCSGGEMKKLIAAVLFFISGLLFANDFRWNLINALTRNDYPTAENIISQNIDAMPPVERRILINFALTYSHGDTSLRTLELLQRHNVRPSGFDLYTAINRNQPDAVVYFIMNTGVIANGEILLLAMEKQRFDLAMQFIQAGADVNYQYPLTRNDTNGMTALLHASRFNNFELLQMLTERGADINARNRDGNTALSIAQTNGNVQISDFLIERGAIQNTAAPAQPQPQQTGGLAGLFDSREVVFQPGTYRLSGGNRDLTFTGNAHAGRIGFMRNNRVLSGAYQIAGGNLTVMMDGGTFLYTIDSSVSFSGHGEVWLRTGN